MPTTGRPADAAAFWNMAQQYRPYLKAVAQRVLGQRLQGKVDASDVVQQSLVAAVEQFGQFRGQGLAEWQAWLVAIVRNEAINVVRYWSQEERDPHREQSLKEGGPAGLQLAADTSSPGQKAARREQATRLMAAMDRLPPDYREVIVLRNFEALSHGELAARMGRSGEAVRQLWVRAVRRLREELGEDL
ncbi:MAG TPA: sigma-70 family RNA polymerase sigma factor [Gemmataceae bacterium]|nr:sigma-70 family RNA polymerase sigma factor [Gemmataceae bacterium]